MKESEISELSSSNVVFVCGINVYLYWLTHFQHINNMAAVSRGWKVDSWFEKLTYYGTWPTQFHTWFLCNSRNRFSPHILLKKPAQKRNFPVSIFCLFHSKLCSVMNLSQNIFISQDFNSLIFRNKNDKKWCWDLANKVNISDLEKKRKKEPDN